MRFLPLNNLLSQLGLVFKKYPLQFIITLVAVVVAFLLPDAQPREDSILSKILAACLLAFTSSLAAWLFARSKQLEPLLTWALQGAAVIISAAIVIWLRPFIWPKDIIIFLFFVVAFHLAVSYAAFTQVGAVSRFWDFNKTLFLRFLTAALYSAVIMAGLFAALGAIHLLFDADIKSSTYLRIAVIIGIGFNTAFFLAGVPDVNGYNYESSYPKGLKIFTQFVLIPLMTVYLIILFLYEIKIIIAWELPKGYVSGLILGYAVFGILSLLLVHPVKELEENKWIKWFSKFFYIMMVPLLILLALAIYKRVSDYGITEGRYILILVAIWLTGLTFYFLLGKKQTIKIIPISLSIFCIISAIGPQGAASVSKRSQLNRLKTILKSPNKENADETASIIQYLTNNHGLVSLQPLLKENTAVIQSGILEKVKDNYYADAKRAMKDTAYALLKIKDIKTDFTAPKYRAFQVKEEELLKVQGYDWAYRVVKNIKSTFAIADQNMGINTLKENMVQVSLEGDEFVFNVDSTCTAIAERHKLESGGEITVPDFEMAVKKESKKYRLLLQLTRFNVGGSNSKGKPFLDYDGYLLIGKK